MKKSENGMAGNICLLILSILFVSFLLAGSCHAYGRSSMSQDKYAGDVHILCSGHHRTDSAAFLDKAAQSSLSLYRRERENSKGFISEIYMNSFMAVLFKMAVFSCIILRTLPFVVKADIFLQRVIHGFIHLQDGKKRRAFQFSI